MNYLSTIGVKVGYAVAETNGTMPTAFEWLESCKSVGGIDLSQEAIDVTTLSSYIREYTDGLMDTGGTWNMTCGICDESVDEIEAMQSVAANAKTAKKEVWWNVWFPLLKKSFYVIAMPITKTGLPETGVNAAAEISISLTINRYHGLDEAVEPTKAAA